jgi:hypothetical protein
MFIAYTYSDLPGVMGSGEVTYDGPASPLILQRDIFAPDLDFYWDYPSSQTQLEAKYPNTSYTFTLTGPSLGTQSATLTIPQESAAPPILLMTGDSFNRLQGRRIRRDFSLSPQLYPLPDSGSGAFGSGDGGSVVARDALRAVSPTTKTVVHPQCCGLSGRTENIASDATDGDGM